MCLLLDTRHPNSKSQSFCLLPAVQYKNQRFISCKASQTYYCSDSSCYISNYCQLYTLFVISDSSSNSQQQHQIYFYVPNLKISLRLTGYGSLCTLANLRTCTNLWNEVFPVTSHIHDLNEKWRLLINQLKTPRSKGDGRVLPTVEVRCVRKSCQRELLKPSNRCRGQTAAHCVSSIQSPSQLHIFLHKAPTSLNQDSVPVSSSWSWTR